jgi:hypothetical protein
MLLWGSTGLDYWHGRFSLFARFVKVLNPLPLSNCAVRFWVEPNACKWPCCYQMYFMSLQVVFQRCDCQMEQLYRDSELGFEIFTSTKAVTGLFPSRKNSPEMWNGRTEIEYIDLGQGPWPGKWEKLTLLPPAGTVSNPTASQACIRTQI